MKVLHVLPSLSLKLGGPTQVALNLVRNLRELDIDAEIATTDDGVDSGQLNNMSEFKDIPVHYFAASILKFRQYILSFSFLLWFWKNCKKYDLIDIHYFFTFSGTAAFLVAKIKGVPYSVRPMGQLTEWSFNYKKIKKRIYWYLFDYWMLINASLVQCTSEEEISDVCRITGKDIKCELLGLGANQPEVINNAKVLLRRNLSIPEDALIILFMSRLHEKKRPDHLINVFKNISAPVPLYLILAGSGDPGYIIYLKKIINKYNLDKNIIFSGFVYDGEKSLLLQGSDIFTLPSYSENFGIAVAEAMACGLPVVVSANIQISDEIKKSDAGIVINDEEDTLQKALSELIDSKEKRELFGFNAKSLAQDKFSWRKSALAVKEAYLKVILQT